MKVILNQDVTGLGEEGDIKEVAPGYARNYLLPKKLAVPHTKEFLAQLGHKRAAIENRKETKRLEAAGLKERLEAEEIKFSLPAGENGKLFGSVNNANVVTELEKKGYAIEKKRVEIPDHTIRNTGTYRIRIRLYDKEEATVKVVVEGIAQHAAAPAKPRAHGPRSRRSEAATDGAPAAVEAPAAKPAGDSGEPTQDS